MDTGTNQEPEEHDPLSRLANYGLSEGVIVNPRCKLCNSPNRKEVEAMADQKIPISKIKVFLDSKGEDIAAHNISNHIFKHYLALSGQLALQDINEKVGVIVRSSASRVDAIEKMIAISWVELGRCLALEATTMESEKERQRMIQDNIKSLRDGYTLLHTLDENDGNKFANMQERFQKIFQVRLASAKSDEEKRSIVSDLQAVKAAMSGI